MLEFVLIVPTHQLFARALCISTLVLYIGDRHIERPANSSDSDNNDGGLRIECPPSIFNRDQIDLPVCTLGYAQIGAVRTQRKSNQTQIKRNAPDQLHHLQLRRAQ
jgi:hypothetical protein